MEGLCSVMVYLSVRTQRYHCMSVTYALCLPEHPCMRVAGLHGLSMHAHERAAALICSPYMVGVKNLRLAKKVAESMMSYLISFLLKPGKPGNQTPIVATCFVFTLHKHGSNAAKLLHWTAVTKQHRHARMQFDRSQTTGAQVRRDGLTTNWS